MKILHALAQRPDSTGSGVTLDALVRCASKTGWDQAVVCGVAHDASHPEVADLAPDRIHPLRFGGNELPFALPGMSDVMPYASTRYRDMTDEQVHLYRRAWTRHLERVLTDFTPDVIHSHHVWLLSALLKDVAPEIPVVTHCHATGLRQMMSCPELGARVVAGCARNDRFVALVERHADALVNELAIERTRVHVVGAGFRDELFALPAERAGDGAQVAYVGKLAHAKGLPWLLDAVERVAVPGLTLHVAGSGGGEEAAALEARMGAMACVRMHGQLTQAELADLLRSCDALVLPSFYEGLPLVLVEALACGCRPVCTRLPGVVDEIVPRVGDVLELVDLPGLRGADTPLAADLPAFVDRLVLAIGSALARGPVADPPVAEFTWGAVFARVEAVWREILA